MIVRQSPLAAQRLALPLRHTGRPIPGQRDRRQGPPRIKGARGVQLGRSAEKLRQETQEGVDLSSSSPDRN
jgi:hypothetical protein